MVQKRKLPEIEEKEGKKEKLQRNLGPILIAEDDPVARKLLEKKLKEWGYKVHKAENGQEAWKILTRTGLRIAILDWMMPGLEGPEICQRLRKFRKPHYTYLILLTARDTSYDIIQGLEAGADDYMTKPINLLELKARLQTAHRIIELEDNLIKAQKKLSKLATTDSLTQAWNRRTIFSFIQEELNRYKREGQPFGLLMADVDNFKEVNDKYGHQAGDSVLKQLVNLIKKNLRNYDRVGRYGGDELLLLLPGSDIFNTGLIASRLLGRVRNTRFRVSPRTAVSLTLSIGGTATDSLIQPQIENLIRTADRALYLAKNLGRDRLILFGDSANMDSEEKVHERKR